jgi:hypothetical protein
MRYPEDEKKYKFLDEKHSELGDFLKILYQIRCNLFHGEKYPDPSPNDLKILCWAGKRLEELLILINDETIAK